MTAKQKDRGYTEKRRATLKVSERTKQKLAE